MKPLIRHAVVFTFSLALSLSAKSQVVVKLNSRRFNDYDPIKVTILNRQSHSISVCVSEEWIPKPHEDVGVASTPFLMQAQNGRKWVTVLNGVDLGPPLRYEVVIEPGNTAEFQTQTKGRWKRRFILYYWDGDDISACGNPSGRKKAISPTFRVATRQDDSG